MARTTSSRLIRKPGGAIGIRRRRYPFSSFITQNFSSGVASGIVARCAESIVVVVTGSKFPFVETRFKRILVIAVACARLPGTGLSTEHSTGALPTKLQEQIR